jgi:hypothetical protein
MNKEIVKKGFELAQKETQDKQINEVKLIVTRTLERIADYDKEIEKAKQNVKDLEEKKKILKLDIEDIKDGRLDRIAERQEKDEKAKAISVIIVIKEKETIIERERPYYPWYQPWTIVWQDVPVITTTPVFWNHTAGNGLCLTTTGSNTCDYQCDATFTLNNSVAKFAGAGAYEVYGNVVNLR